MKYREMTAEEKLAYSAEVIEATRKGGLTASLEVVEKYKSMLEIENKSEEVPTIKETEVGPIHEVIDLSPKTASIYAREHLGAVQADLMDTMPNMGEDKHKTKILENPSFPAQVVHEENIVRPNPWGDAKTVEPGEVKNMLTR